MTQQDISYKPSLYNILIELKGGKTLAFNTLRQTLAVWDEADAKVYSRIADDKDCSEDEREKGITDDLLRGGFIIKSEEDERKRLEEAFSMIRFGRKNMSLTIAPTLLCNFACDYCYQGSGAAALTMDDRVFERLLEHLDKRAPGLSRLGIAWYGGEPLLQKDRICEMSDRLMEFCARNNIKYSAMMVTNGYGLSGDTAQTLAKKHVSLFQITLDGDRKTHDTRRIKKDGSGTFDRIIGNLKDALGRPGVNLMVRVNVDKRNVEGAFELLETLHEEGFSGKNGFSVYFAPVDVCSAECTRIESEVLTFSEYARIETQLLKKAIELKLAKPRLPGIMNSMCAAIKPNGFVILPNGDVHKCWNTVSDPSQRVCTVETLEEAEKTGVSKKWLSWSPFSEEDCRQCPVLPACTGACANRVMMGRGAPCTSIRENIREKLLLYSVYHKAIKEDDIY